MLSQFRQLSDKKTAIPEKENTHLLLTACIDPKAYNIFLPTERVSHYIDTLRYYLAVDIKVKGIVFVENSGYPLDVFRSLPNPYNRNVEFISCNCVYPEPLKVAYRKSYGEMFAINEAMESSELLRDAAYIAKLTGRIRLMNFDRLLYSVRRQFGLFCDIKDHGWLVQRLRGVNDAGPYCDTRFLAFTREFYSAHLKNLLSRIAENKIVLERLMYQVAIDPALKNEVIRRFPIEPYFSGFSGTRKGTSYDSIYGSAARRIRSVARIAFPWLHI
jgi:hypothetical protein